VNKPSSREPDVSAIVRTVIAERRDRPAPRATYRLQFNHTFTFRDATEIVPYLAGLGVSHVYASPLFAAAAGSMHGYDVVDYGRINPEIGTREEFDAFVDALHAHDLGLIVDFVPNHMGIDGGANAWWQDVIENGEMSRYARYFDIDWSPLKRELHGKVLLPFLGDQYGEVLERGELKLSFVDGGFEVRYWETPFPIDPRTYSFILQPVLDDLSGVMEADDLDLLELGSVVSALDRLPGSEALDEQDDAIEARYREQVVSRHRLAMLVERSQTIREAIEAAVAALNGAEGEERSFDRLDHLLNLQPYRLSFWRVAAEEINYRRFFAINTLAAIRQEDPEVFEETHRLLSELIAEGAVDGVRIDHPDGLWDPAGYFRQLQTVAIRALARREMGQVEDEEWLALAPAVDQAISAELDEIAAGDRRWPLYVVGEKILEHGEGLPEDWAVAGTVGYEFARSATGLFVDSEARQLFDRIYGRFTGDKIRFPELVHEMKMRMMIEAFASEVNVLVNGLNRISERDRHSRDFTVNSLGVALREIMANFPVYRTYTTCDELGVTERDQQYIRNAVSQARRRNRALDPSLFSFIEEVLLLRGTGNPRERMDLRCYFAMKMQQLTGPVMAKGLEDTAFYRFNRLVSLNEVGGDPNRFGSSEDEFHRQNRARLRTWPEGMLTSSTHDTKRSEDVRARISVLSEVPAEWRAAINRWSRLNRKLKVLIDGALAPHRVDEYTVYQTLIGTWPTGNQADVDWDEYRDRLQEYIIKVAREASRVTNWTNPDEAYETAIRDFVAGLLNRRRSRAFLEDFGTFQASLLDGGLANALAQQGLKLTSPGVPDIYQGTEVWDDSLVDPDNRRPVDFAARQALMRRIEDSDIGDLDPEVGKAKLAVTSRLLRERAAQPELFATGDYTSVTVEGPSAEHAVAFVRTTNNAALLVVVPRLLTKLDRATGEAGDRWNGTSLSLPSSLADAQWRNVLGDGVVKSDGGRLELGTLLAGVPVAVLTTAN
jgi:(1->4)-alpha-D-glucan 1-alpha-D-glucosylmutase